MSYQNRLIHEKSPYLLQHADNPVDWYPWSQEAFKKAQQEDKPIFLSIGYSTCHWCHVMEHESFENVEIAGLLNEHFVPIKVDREERPDIDGIYMSAVQAITGQGGWPLNIFLTPDKKPFFGGTYFPPEAKWGSAGFADILKSIHNAWRDNRAQLIESGDNLTKLLQDYSPSGQPGVVVGKEVIDQAYSRFLQSFDKRHGGFGHAPKFPTAHNLNFLLRYWYSMGREDSLEMVLTTLKNMAEGGLYDHIGGGFHRYSTDEMWQIPHFEKMLYDQAALSKSYLEAYQITKDEYYADVARAIFTYVRRELGSKEGAFYSAEDADSFEPKDEGGETTDVSSILHPPSSLVKKEGAFYLWRYDELKKVLNAGEWELFVNRYDIKEEGNAHADPHDEFGGKNIIFGRQSMEEVAKKTGVSMDEAKKRLSAAKLKLFNVRGKRPRPHLDDKIIVDWNSLMISSLAFASRVLSEPDYLDEAKNAADFILKNLIDGNGRLLHRYREGDAAILGTVEDYAFFIQALLDLYEASFETRYLKKAIDLNERMIDLFWDDKNGAFYFTGYDAEKLILRQKEVYDGAIPSGNSVAALNLIRLYHFTLNQQWQKYFDRLISCFSNELLRNPTAYTQLLIAVQFDLGPSQEIIIVEGKDNDLGRRMIEAVFRNFLPYKVVILKKKNEADILKVSGFLLGQTALENKTTLYLCENHICKLPVNRWEQFEESLKRLKPAYD